MASNLKRRLEALEARAPAPARFMEIDREAVRKQLDALERSYEAYAAMSVADKIKVKRKELRELQAREPSKCTTYSIRLVEIDLAELEGQSAGICEDQRFEAECALSGVRRARPQGESTRSVQRVVEREVLTRVICASADMSDEFDDPPQMPKRGRILPLGDPLAHYRAAEPRFFEPGSC